MGYLPLVLGALCASAAGVLLIGVLRGIAFLLRSTLIGVQPHAPAPHVQRALRELAQGGTERGRAQAAPRDALRVSATELARRIAGGDTTAEAALRLMADAAARANERTNAVVAERAAAALREAREWDERIASGAVDVPPFAGVPISIKECFAVAGMPHTSGLAARAAPFARAEADSTAVARLRAAGFVVLCTTNISELCMWYESANPLYGRTGNPYDPQRIVGGSSGGEAALIGAGASICGLGSDVGGSIRMPAFFCGVFGHKPTGGRVPCTGQYPNARGAALHYLATGPICRYADDLWPMMEVLQGPDGVDTGADEAWEVAKLFENKPRSRASAGNATGPPRPSVPAEVVAAGWQHVRVLTIDAVRYATPPLTSQPSTAMSRALVSALDALVGPDGAGATGGTLALPEFRDGLDMWASKLALAEQVPFAESLAEGRSSSGLALAWELCKSMLGLPGHSIPALGLALMEGIPMALNPKAVKRSAAAADALKERLIAELGDWGVLLFPSHPRVAPRHGVPLLYTTDWVYTALWNALSFPVTQVPLGLDSNGLPVGLQVVGAPGSDALCIAVAMELERACGGWREPST